MEYFGEGNFSGHPVEDCDPKLRASPKPQIAYQGRRSICRDNSLVKSPREKYKAKSASAI